MKDWKITLSRHTGPFVIGMLILTLIVLGISQPRMRFFDSMTPSEEVPKIESNIPTPLSEVGGVRSDMGLSPIELPNKTSLSYAEAVALYGETRLQFVENCGILSTKVVHPQGTTVLVENRSDTQLMIGVAGQRYTLPGRSFLPLDFLSIGAFPVECNGFPNVITLYIQ